MPGPGIENPVKLIAANAFANNAEYRSIVTKSVTTGVNADLSVVNQILGAKTRSAANLTKAVIANMGTGFNVVNTALTTLKNLRGVVEDIKIDIASLTNADPQTLVDAQGNFEKQIANIYQILGNTNFAGKNLFDGTLANRVINPPPAYMPNNFGPLTVPTGTSVAQNVNIAIPRLLTGDGTFPEVPVPGMSEPLIPTIDGSLKAAQDEVTAFKNAINDAAVNNITAADATGVSHVINGLAIASDIEDLVVGIDDTVKIAITGGNNADPTGGSMDATRNAICDVIDLVSTVFETAHGSLAANGNASSNTLILKNITDAQDAIKQFITDARTAAATQGDIREAARDFNVIPLIPDNANSDLRAIYESMATVVKAVGLASFTIGDAVINSTDGVAAANEEKKAINVSLDSVAATVGKITAPAGNIETPAGRARATTLLDSVTTKLDSVITQLTGAKDNLEIAKSNLDSLLIELDNAANTYLSTDYSKEIPKLIESVRKDRLSALGLALSEKAINAILDQLQQMAATAA